MNKEFTDFLTKFNSSGPSAGELYTSSEYQTIFNYISSESKTIF